MLGAMLALHKMYNVNALQQKNIWVWRNFWKGAALSAQAAPQSHMANHGHSIWKHLGSGKCCVLLLFYVRVHIHACTGFPLQHAKCMIRPCVSSKSRMRWKLTKKPTQRKILSLSLLTACWLPRVAQIANHLMMYVLSFQHTASHSSIIAPCTLPCIAQSSHCTVYTALHSTIIALYRVHCIA